MDRGPYQNLNCRGESLHVFITVFGSLRRWRDVNFIQAEAEPATECHASEVKTAHPDGRVRSVQSRGERK